MRSSPSTGPMQALQALREDLKIHCPEMVIERESGIDLEGLHDGKARAVRVAEFLIFEFEKEFPCLFFVFPPHGHNRCKAAVLQPSAEVARYDQAEPPPEQGYRFVENEVGCQQGNLVTSQERSSVSMIGIFFVNKGIPGPGINENALHLELPWS